MPPDILLRHAPAPLRYPLPQEVEWRMLLVEGHVTNARRGLRGDDRGSSCRPSRE